MHSAQFYQPASECQIPRRVLVGAGPRLPARGRGTPAALRRVEGGDLRGAPPRFVTRPSQAPVKSLLRRRRLAAVHVANTRIDTGRVPEGAAAAKVPWATNACVAIATRVELRCAYIQRCAFPGRCGAGGAHLPIRPPAMRAAAVASLAALLLLCAVAAWPGLLSSPGSALAPPSALCPYAPPSAPPCAPPAASPAAPLSRLVLAAAAAQGSQPLSLGLLLGKTHGLEVRWLVGLPGIFSTAECTRFFVACIVSVV